MNRKFPAKLLFVPATTLLLTALSVIPVQLLQSALAQPETPETPGPVAPESVTPGGSTNNVVTPVPENQSPIPTPPEPPGTPPAGESGGSVVTDPEPEQPTTPIAYPVRW